MSTDENTKTAIGWARDRTSRRRLLAALGAAAMPAVAGCAGSPEAGGDTGTTTPTMEPTAGTQEADSQPIDPRFGDVGTGDDDPPVEPDHTIDLLIREREDTPIPEFYFEPVGLAIDVGDTVRFDLATPHHNVNAYHPAFGYTQRVPEDAPPYSSPILGAGEYWLYTFETEGVHNVMCAPHELFGMVGSIVVGSPSGPAANPVGEAPAPSDASRPPEFTAGLVLSDPALDPEAVADAGSVSWSDLAPESKRLLLAPIEE
jgi:plastocyanin